MVITAPKVQKHYAGTGTPTALRSSQKEGAFIWIHDSSELEQSWAADGAYTCRLVGVFT